MKWSIIAGAAASAVVVLVGGALGIQYLVSPKSYDECLLAEMRGQDQAMFWTAKTACERRHAVEVEIPITSDDWRWANDRLYTVVTLSSEILASYTPTRGQFAFSTETCENTDLNSMEKHVPSFAEDGGFRLGIMAPSDPKCLRMLELWGTRN